LLAQLWQAIGRSADSSFPVLYLVEMILRPHRTSSLRTHTFASAVGAAAVAAVLLAGCSSSASGSDVTAPASAAVPSDVGLLFSVIAPTLEVATEGDGFRLTISASSPTAWFTDRPARKAGSFEAADLVSLWSAEQFDTDPPNAAVVVTLNGEQHQHVVELSDPVATATTVSFHATDLADDHSVDPVAGRDATHDVAAGSYGQSELFIDDGTGVPCASSITTIDSYACLLAANHKVSVQATFDSSWNISVQITKTSPQSASPTGSIAISGSKTSGTTYVGWGPCASPCNIKYFSGQQWTVTSGSVAANVAVGVTDDDNGGGPRDG